MIHKTSKINNFGAIILAGGKSRRFGEDKVTYPLNGKPLIQNVIEVVEKVTENIIIVTNTPEKLNFLGYPKFADIFPNSGPMGGIYTGLTFSRSNYNLVLPSDMPYISVECFEYLIRNANGSDIIIPEHDNLLEPLCAIYAKSCLATIKKFLDRNEYHVFKLCEKIKTKKVEFGPELDFYHDRLFFNINEKTDLK